MGRFADTYVGFRAWWLEGGRLRALNGTPWQNGGPTTAECFAQGRAGPESGTAQAHAVPAPGCTCGLYALHEPEERHGGSDQMAFVLGAVVGWGRIEIHIDGFRAEHALPVALCQTKAMGPAAYEKALAWCDEWEVPLCPTVSELEVEAFRYADLVPMEARGRALEESISAN